MSSRNSSSRGSNVGTGRSLSSDGKVSRQSSFHDVPAGPSFSTEQVLDNASPPILSEFDRATDRDSDKKKPSSEKQEVLPTNTAASLVAPNHAEESKESTAAKSTARRTRTRTNTNKKTSEATDFGMSTVKWQNLQNLQNLMNAGFITKTEYAERKGQLIDDMTGTTCSGTTVGSTRGTMHRANSDIKITPKPPPDFANIPNERATKFVYDLAARKWITSSVTIKLDTVPFSQGALRLVYHLMQCKENNTGKKMLKARGAKSVEDEDRDNEETEGGGEGTVTYVAKISKDPRDQSDREIYFRDVEMQSVAKYYAQMYNEYDPPKKVDFVKAWLLQLDDREGAPICGVERFINGPYIKHNNNYGFVSDDERNTPQAFSHFTYESSKQTMLVCDIQGT